MPAAKVSQDRFDRLFNAGGAWRKIAGSKRRYLCEHDSFGRRHSPVETPKGMCPCFDDMAAMKDPNADLVIEPHPDFKSKRRRLECPLCKRRVIARVRFCADGCCKAYQLPVHKPKHWWKKKKKQPMRESACRRV